MYDLRYLSCYIWHSLVALFATVPLMAFSSSMATVIVKVSVMKPPSCTINDNRPIEVEFGEVLTTQVDGKNKSTPVNYTVRCSGADVNTRLNLQVQGLPASFDNTILQSTSEGLGVALKVKKDGILSPFAINTWWQNVTPTSLPELWAVPVKQNGVTLRGGEFSAGATMSVAYP